MFTVIDRREQPGAQQLRQLAGIHFVALVAVAQQSVLAWVTDDDFGCGLLEHVVEPGGMSAFLKRHFDLPT